MVASAALIRDNLGVDIPDKVSDSSMASHAPSMHGTAGSSITATLDTVIGGDTNGTTAILTPMSLYKNWTWTGGTLPAQYMPKN